MNFPKSRGKERRKGMGAKSWESKVNNWPANIWSGGAIGWWRPTFIADGARLIWFWKKDRSWFLQRCAAAAISTMVRRQSQWMRKNERNCARQHSTISTAIPIWRNTIAASMCCRCFGKRVVRGLHGLQTRFSKGKQLSVWRKLFYACWKGAFSNWWECIFCFSNAERLHYKSIKKFANVSRETFWKKFTEEITFPCCFFSWERTAAKRGSKNRRVSQRCLPACLCTKQRMC